MVLLAAIKENICSEYQRDPKVEKLFMSQDIRHINARRLTKKELKRSSNIALEFDYMMISTVVF